MSSSCYHGYKYPLVDCVHCLRAEVARLERDYQQARDARDNVNAKWVYQSRRNHELEGHLSKKNTEIDELQTEVDRLREEETCLHAWWPQIYEAAQIHEISAKHNLGDKICGGNVDQVIGQLKRLSRAHALLREAASAYNDDLYSRIMEEVGDE